MTPSLATCQCSVMTKHSCGALATQEDLLCDQCRAFRSPTSSGEQNMHLASAVTGFHTSYSNVSVSIQSLCVTSADQLEAVGWKPLL